MGFADMSETCRDTPRFYLSRGCPSLAEKTTGTVTGDVALLFLEQRFGQARRFVTEI